MDKWKSFSCMEDTTTCTVYSAWCPKCNATVYGKTHLTSPNDILTKLLKECPECGEPIEPDSDNISKFDVLGKRFHFD